MESMKKLCKRHPKHIQSPGVCSVCLREKLSRLSSSCNSRSPRAATMESSCSSSSSLSSYASSSSGSSCSSPPLYRYDFGKEKRKSSLSLLLTKSRSMAFVSRLRSGGDAGEIRKKKGGFWAKLLNPRSKRKVGEGLGHSKTMRERVIITRVH